MGKNETKTLLTFIKETLLPVLFLECNS